MIAPHAIDERAHLLVDGVIAAHGNPLAASRGHELGGLVNRLRSIGATRGLTPNRPTRAVHGRAFFTQRDGYPASRSARRARDQRDSILESAQLFAPTLEGFAA